MAAMSHPVALSYGFNLSLNDTMNSHSMDTYNSSGKSFQDSVDAKVINADLAMQTAQDLDADLNIIKEVISVQKSRLAMHPKHRTIKKMFMYKTLESLIESDPEDMIGHFIYQKNFGERPILSKIFQKYVSIIESNLPLKVMNEYGVEVEIYSLNAPELGLFLGLSEYTSFVKPSGLVSNETHEIYTGAECNGPCFIGLLCDVLELKTGKSLLSNVEYYTFNSIKMNNFVAPETMVKVIHYRIPPHYEMMGLVLLNRLKKKVIESVFKRRMPVANRLSA
jgi:hypothetical protein